MILQVQKTKVHAPTQVLDLTALAWRSSIPRWFPATHFFLILCCAHHHDSGSRYEQWQGIVIRIHVNKLVRPVLKKKTNQKQTKQTTPTKQTKHTLASPVQNHWKGWKGWNEKLRLSEVLLQQRLSATWTTCKWTHKLRFEIECFKMDRLLGNLCRNKARSKIPHWDFFRGCRSSSGLVGCRISWTFQEYDPIQIAKGLGTLKHNTHSKIPPWDSLVGYRPAQLKLLLYRHRSKTFFHFTS